ncbi:MAG TPA: hypothetical protein DGT21_25135 [Armatimonadetes bacterium]|jgi:hypothetical protein|nr:hypothetical protein [Armatimonadota bacterium]
MSEQTLSTVQVLGALLPATGLLGLLVYARCRSAGCSSRRTVATIATVCGAVLVSAGTLLLARQALSGGLFDLGLRLGEDGQPYLQTSDLRARSWAAPELAILGTAAAVTIVLWVLAMRCVRGIPRPAWVTGADGESVGESGREPEDAAAESTGDSTEES